MSVFKTLDPSELDPHKRMNYVQGLVLGVDEFKQEQLHFLERDRIHQRALHGYGTVNGLAVSIADDGGGAGPEVRVSAGLAVDSRGRSICVPTAQCGKLNEWLARADAVESSPPGTRTVYLHLCYRECATDQVPIPSGPCKTGEESMQPSRVAESFHLRFDTQPPDQAEERLATLFGQFLERFEVTNQVASPNAPFDPEAFFGTDFDLENPPPESPPVPPSRLQVHPDDLEATLKSLLRWWITLARPRLLGDGCAGPPADQCVLLARLDFAVTEATPPLVDGTVTINEEARPYLLSTRLLQEWARIGASAFESDATLAGSEAGGDLSGTYPDPQVNGIQGYPVVLPSPPVDGQALVWSAETWRLAGPPVLEGDPAGGDVTGNYPDQLIVSGILGRGIQSPLSLEDVEENSVLVWRQPQGTETEGHWEIAPQTGAAEIPPAAGDVLGDLDELTVVGLQGRALSATRPQTGQILVFRRGTLPANDQWQIGNVPAPTNLIVAAGFFNLAAGPSAIGPTLGDLTLTSRPDLGAGVHILLFPAYEVPDPPQSPRHAYVVKGTPVEGEGPVQGSFRVFHFGDFNPFLPNAIRPDEIGILIKIVDRSGQGGFLEGGCMIEVTRIDS